MLWLIFSKVQDTGLWLVVSHDVYSNINVYFPLFRGFAKRTLMKTARKAGLKPKESSKRSKYIMPTPPLTRRMGSLDERTPSIGPDEELAGKSLDWVSLSWVIHILMAQLNPLHAKFFRGNKNIHLHLMTFPHIDMTQVLQILPQVRPGPTYSTQSISLLLMPWRRKEPGHQQPWYWPS